MSNSFYEEEYDEFEENSSTPSTSRYSVADNGQQNSNNGRNSDRISVNDISSVNNRRSVQSNATAGNDTETSEEIVLSLFWGSGKLAAAYYTMETSEISILYDIIDVNPEYLITKCFFNQIQPSQVITSGRLSEKFLNTLKVLSGLEYNDNGDKPQFQSKLHILSGKDYNYQVCKSKVLGMKLASEPEGLNEEGHLTYIHSIIDMNAETMVYALGGLLGFLEKSWCDIALEVTERHAPVLSIKIISIDDMVFMDPDSYSALQIFNPINHPSGFKKWSANNHREGLSLYGIFKRCRSTLGSKWMKIMFLHPTRDIKIINERLDVIEFCMKQKNSEVLNKMLDGLQNIKNINRILTRMRGIQTTVREWKTLYSTIYNAILIGELCSNLDEDINLFKQIANCLNDELYQIGQSINTFMDFEESESNNRFVVKPGIDRELDEKKQKYSGLSQLLSTVANHELSTLPAYIKQCSVVYIPEIGYLLALPAWKDIMQPDDFNLPGLELMFKANNVGHYKTARCRELDDMLGDILVNILEHETKIMVRLVQYIETRINNISSIIDLLAQLDCLAAMAIVAKENGYVRPILTEEHIIEINEGRHPLQELCVSDFVANNTTCGGDNKNMKILTGPNASGKSVYLKQVALITYLAHIGSFVPAKSAKIGLQHHIFTRIQTNESIATRLSAFMIDLRQVSLALQCSTSRSLIIIDEFGKGTSEIDGITLLASTLNSLLDRGEYCPFVFVSTHFHHLIELINNKNNVHQQTLEHTCDEENKIIYLYKLKDGFVNHSFALQLAETQGLSKPIINRAQQVLDHMKNNQTITRDKNLKISTDLKKKEEIAKKFLALDLEADDFAFHVRNLMKEVSIIEKQ